MPATASESFWRHLSAYQASWANDVVNDAADLARQTAPVEPQTAVHLTETAVIALRERPSRRVCSSSARAGGAVRLRRGLGRPQSWWRSRLPARSLWCPAHSAGTFDVETGGDVVVGVDGSRDVRNAPWSSPSPRPPCAIPVSRRCTRGPCPWLRSTLSIRHEVVNVTRQPCSRRRPRCYQSLAEIRQKHPAVPVVEQAVEERPAVALVRSIPRRPAARRRFPWPRRGHRTAARFGQPRCAPRALPGRRDSSPARSLRQVLLIDRANATSNSSDVQPVQPDAARWYWEKPIGRHEAASIRRCWSNWNSLCAFSTRACSSQPIRCR